QHPADVLAPRASLLLARLRLADGDLDGALRLAEVMADGPAEVQGEARLLLGRVYLLQERPEECARQLVEAQLQLEQPELRQEALLLTGECQLRLGQHAAALKSLSMVHAEGDEALRGFLHERVRRIALEGLRASEASALRSRVPGPLADGYLGLRAGLEALRREDVQGAAEVLRRIEPWFMAEGQVAELQTLQEGLRRLEQRARPDTIAALLPLTGPSRRIGSAMLDALLVAARLAGPVAPGARLRVIDTRGDAQRVLLTVEQLAASPEVIGVVGPFDAETAAAAASKASQLGLPLIHVTVDGVVPHGEGPVFRAYTSNRKEARRLAGHAVRTLGIRRVAILRPEHTYGQTLAALLREAWEELGGAVAGEVTYPAHAREMKTVLDRLAALPPFEALFIPDGQDQVGLLAAHLAARGWWSVPFGSKPPKVRGRALVPVQLLGTSAWYDPRLLARAGQHLEGALVTSGFVQQSPLPVVQQFMQRFTEATGRPPTALDAYARDAFRLLAALVEGDEPLGRGDVEQRLHRSEPFEDLVTSLRSFDERGEPSGDPLLVKISAESFQYLPEGG
ncbi:MAG: hypothetical protein FJ125_10330, partial [Deltaproteobacteria bacterium]|nr:hypothetical protein [Deltaproteobacteria bacterium]